MRPTRIVIRGVLDDIDPDLHGLAGVEARPVAGGVDLQPWAAHEVLVVSADADLLAAVGALGQHRLLATDPGATAAAVFELCQALDRP